jgi:hypothetical protein
MASRALLSQLHVPRESRIFFYFDAHWSEDLPLADETEFIILRFNIFTILL